MARITKLELEQQLIASQRDNAALRHELSVLRAEWYAAEHKVDHLTAGCSELNDEIAALRAQLEAAQPAVPAPKADWPTVRQATQRKVPAHFAAARELAMRTGRSVRVSA